MNTTWFNDVRVVDVSSGRVSAPQAVGVEGDTIFGFASAPPRNATIIDGAGQFLCPGLIDAHVHFFLPGNASPVRTYLASSAEEKLAIAENNASIALQSGITTMRDCGAPAPLMVELRNRLKSELAIGPHVVSCGAPLTRPRGHLHFFGEEVGDEGAVRAAIHRQLRNGNEFVKLIASGGGLTPHTDPAEADLPASLVEEAVRVAHSNGAPVAAHCHATESIVRALDAQVDTIEHASFLTKNGPCYEDAIACRLRDSSVIVTPTVIGALHSAAEFRRSGAANSSDSTAIARLEARLHNSGRFRELGVKLVAGTDAGVTNTGFNSLVDELIAYLSVGFSHAQALRTATCDAADYLRLGHIGQVREGWRADLLLLNSNPLLDLNTLREPAMVMKSGRVVIGKPSAMIAN